MNRVARLRGESFTGIQRIPTQDRMANETMGEMLDYDAEHLKSTDLMISRHRCRVFAAAEPARREGYFPPGVDNPDLFNGARGGDYLVPDHLSLLDTYRTQMEQVGSGSTGVLAKWRSAGNNLLPQPPLTPKLLISVRVFSYSLWMRSANSFGVLVRGSLPRWARLS